MGDEAAEMLAGVIREEMDLVRKEVVRALEEICDALRGSLNAEPSSAKPSLPNPPKKPSKAEEKEAGYDVLGVLESFGCDAWTSVGMTSFAFRDAVMACFPYYDGQKPSNKNNQHWTGLLEEMERDKYHPEWSVHSMGGLVEGRALLWAKVRKLKS